MNIVSYLFWPNPGNALYGSPKIFAILLFGVVLVLASVWCFFWRRRLTDSQLKKCSRSWPSASLWFGVAGIVLVISRVEQIQFMAMRALVFVWLGALVAYILLQIKLFRLRYFKVIPQQKVDGQREKYLPRRKK